MSLVDDDTIEREITGSRLVLAMMDRASWEFTDLRTRMQMLEGQDDLATTDLLRAQVVARLVLESWTKVGLTGTVWQLLHTELHEEFAQLQIGAYHDCNHWLVAQKVMPEVDCGPSSAAPRAPAAWRALAGAISGGAGGGAAGAVPHGGGSVGAAHVGGGMPATDEAGPRAAWPRPRPMIMRMASCNACSRAMCPASRSPPARCRHARVLANRRWPGACRQAVIGDHGRRRRGADGQQALAG